MIKEASKCSEIAEETPPPKCSSIEREMESPVFRDRLERNGMKVIEEREREKEI